MKDHEIRNLAQQFGILGLFVSKYHLERLFAFVREVEKRAKESA